MLKIYKNTSSRLAAIQLVYSLDTSGELRELENLERKLEHYNDVSFKENYGIDDKKLSKQFVLKLIEVLSSQIEKVDGMIMEGLDKSETFKHLNVLMLSVLRCAVAELVYFDTPYKIVIKEYIKIASTFFSDSEISLVNGLLDKIVKDRGAA